MRGCNKIGADTDVGVRCVVVVAVTVVVDIGKVRGRHDIPQPPVRTFNSYPTTVYFFLFPARYLLAAFLTPFISAISSVISAMTAS